MTKATKAKPARRHHVIPQLYLSGFTDSGEKNGLLYAHDLRELKTFRAKPSNVAFEKDFYRIDAPGVDIDEIERIFWELETEAARVFKKIIQIQMLPAKRKDYAILMRFMAQLVMRRPNVRESLMQSHEQVMRMFARMTASLPDDQLRAQFDRLREKKPDMPEVDLAAFREFATSDDYTIEFPQNFHIQQLLTTLLPVADETIAPLLAARHWVLWAAQDGAGHFVTTDRPVALSWTVEVPPFYENSPGFGLENTMVVFPISKRLAMYGRFDGPRGLALPANAEQVALINRVMSRSVIRFMYSTDENFRWRNVDDSIGNRLNMFDAIRDHQAKKAAREQAGVRAPAAPQPAKRKPAERKPADAAHQSDNK